MTITVSSGKKFYRRGPDGQLNESRDVFHSQTISLPDDATLEDVQDARIELMSHLDQIVDLQAVAEGWLTRESAQTLAANRETFYERMRARLLVRKGQLEGSNV